LRTARGDLSIVRLDRRFLNGILTRHERPHFILKCAVDRTRFSRDVLLMPQSLCPEYLTKVSNPKVASLRVRHIGAPPSRSGRGVECWRGGWVSRAWSER
jgi:hypothetical protein